MPGKHAGASTEPCRRCGDHISALVVRSEPLCHDCFARYVHTKCIKRLETFRVNFAAAHPQRRVLLPLSFGVSSTTLLHILDLHLKTQQSKTGRTGFAIHALVVEEPGQSSSTEQLLSTARARYPDHQFESLPLSHIFHLLPNDASLRELLLAVGEDQTAGAEEQLLNLLRTLPSATARADVLTTLRARLIVEHAKRSGCESILWGDSTTRLAEKTLAETAKGRGFSLPWQVGDGASPLGVNFHYPLRDVLRKELVAYTNLAEPELASLIQEPVSSGATASMSSKNITIDQLMQQYFESVEENFPSIVSNVVRTTGKLEAPKHATLDPHCSLCGMPVLDGRFGIHGWGGDQDEVDASPSRTGDRLCYGCTRSIPHTTALAHGSLGARS